MRNQASECEAAALLHKIIALLDAVGLANPTSRNICCNYPAAQDNCFYSVVGFADPTYYTIQYRVVL